MITPFESTQNLVPPSSEMSPSLLQETEQAFAMIDQDALGIADLFRVTQRLTEASRSDIAIQLYRSWLERDNSPVAYAAQFNLGVIFSNLNDDVSAEAAYRAAILQKPNFIEGHLNLGTLLERTGRPEEALAVWRAVLSFVDLKVPTDQLYYVQALNNLGRLLEIRKELPDAEAMLARSLMQDPKQVGVMAHWVHLRQKQCEWPVYSKALHIPIRDMIAGTSALAMLSASDDPALQLAAAQNYVNDKVNMHTEALCNVNGYGHEKLRIGYLSSNFNIHAVSLLTVEIYELHDRERVEVYAFCWSEEDVTSYRARIAKAVDHYIRIADMSDDQAANCIRSNEIDILVDLQGLTSGARPNILSARPAPIQISYLGFPGTTGLPFNDYVLADKFVFPEELKPYFTESPLYMPNSFQVCDRGRQVGVLPTKAACGLPEDAFVFCSFNNNFKFTPEVFSTWMRILKRVPNSVLWLLADNEWVKENLCKTAEKSGIKKERLIFASRVTPADYLARYQVADLFLDTYPFNAGTTANDALWVGLPLLTCAGKTFASRMAGSLLLAVDLPELITTNLHDYEDKAVSLANDRASIEAMKRKLIENRLTCSLFDTPQFVKDFENLLLDIVKTHKGYSMTDASSSTTETNSTAMKLPPHVQLDAQQQSRVFSFMVKTVWGLTDPARFYEIMEEAVKLMAPGYYLGDNLLTWGRNNSLFDDEAFRIAWESNVQNDADRAIAWRRYILACAAYHCAQLPGDFVECGVYRGTGIKTVIDYFGNKGFTKTFWGYDTFDYNPVESHSFAGQEDGLFDEIKKRFEGYDQVRLVQGLLPDSLIGNSPEKISYLHIDLNSAEFEIAVLEKLFERVVPGGVIILDDYEWGGIYREQKIAEDAWFEQFTHRVFPLPTGQGLVLKR